MTRTCLHNRHSDQPATAALPGGHAAAPVLAIAIIIIDSPDRGASLASA